jgi:hypothetical protein
MTNFVIILQLFDYTPRGYVTFSLKEQAVSFDYDVRVRTGVILVMALALLSNVRLLLDWIEFDFGFVGQDGVSNLEKRFEPVKSKLPPSGTVGFRSDTPDDLAQYYQTQYTLAPRVVARVPGQEYVISVSGGLGSPVDQTPKPVTLSTSGQDFKMFDFHNGVKIIKSDEQ